MAVIFFSASISCEHTILIKHYVSNPDYPVHIVRMVKSMAPLITRY